MSLHLRKLHLNKSTLNKDLKIGIEEKAVSSKIINTKRLFRLKKNNVMKILRV